MAQERLDLRKEVFNKAQYIKTTNTSFDELGITELNETLESQVSVEEFFDLYNSLFYSIPALGETNSHEYLIKTGGEYINFDQDSQEIEALRAEITSLRRDLLQAQVEKAETLTGEKIDLDVNAIEDSSIAGDDFAKISQEVSSPAINTTNTSVV